MVSIVRTIVVLANTKFICIAFNCTSSSATKRFKILWGMNTLSTNSAETSRVGSGSFLHRPKDALRLGILNFIAYSWLLDQSVGEADVVSLRPTMYNSTKSQAKRREKNFDVTSALTFNLINVTNLFTIPHTRVHRRAHGRALATVARGSHMAHPIPIFLFFARTWCWRTRLLVAWHPMWNEACVAAIAIVSRWQFGDYVVGSREC